MRNFFVIFCVGVFGCVTAQAVLIDGYAYMYGQSVHTGIRVVFHALTPPAESDTVFTNNNGHFWRTLVAGTYDIEYAHASYAMYRLPNQELLSNTNLAPVTLLHPLSGNLSGTVGPGDFEVTDSIVVAVNASLEILPGTRLFFEQGKKFIINGTLHALGTVEDSIVFTRRTASADSAWGGVRFLGADSASRMEYCVVEYGRSRGEEWDELGGSMKINFCNPTISHCAVRRNAGTGSDESGGGICCVWGSPRIENCLITENVAVGNSTGSGAGIRCKGGAPVITGCTITNNTADHVGGGVFITDASAALFENCEITGNSAGNGYGGGLAAYAHAQIRDCWIHDNSARFGGGVAATVGPEFSRCVIENNLAVNGGGLFLGGRASFTNCTVVHDSATLGSAAYWDHSLATINSSILGGSAEYSVLFFAGSANAVIRFSDLIGGDSTLVGFFLDDTTQGPSGLGTLSGQNANGTPCDGSYNILLDPQFVDTANSNYHLLATSPCIDAGDPQLPNDPDGTVADMGAFYFGEEAAREPISPPSSFILCAYPNPFNASVTIAFDLPRAGEVELSIYDILGRRVATLAQGIWPVGRKEILWNASSAASGIYFCRLSGDGIWATRKIVLLK